MADDGDRQSVKTREPADNRCVVRISAVAMNFREVFEQPLDEIQRVRTVGVARELDSFKRGRARVFRVVCH
jgi:hypothetical protein